MKEQVAVMDSARKDPDRSSKRICFHLALRKPRQSADSFVD